MFIFALNHWIAESPLVFSSSKSAGTQETSVPWWLLSFPYVSSEMSCHGRKICTVSLVGKSSFAWGRKSLFDFSCRICGVFIASSDQSDKAVATKERLSGVYRLSAYWLAKMTSELPIVTIVPFCTWTLAYLLVGMPYDIKVYLATSMVMFLGSFLGQVSFRICILQTNIWTLDCQLGEVGLLLYIFTMTTP